MQKKWFKKEFKKHSYTYTGFGHWLTLCTINIYLLYLFIYIYSSYTVRDMQGSPEK